jgi:hypothetical protein
MYIESLLSGGSDYTSVLDNIYRIFPNISISKSPPCGIGDIKFSVTTYMGVFYIQSFPANCGWLLVTNVGSYYRFFQRILDIAEYIAVSMQYSAVIFSVNEEQRRLLRIPDDYKEIFGTSNPHSGKSVFMYAKELSNV